MLTRWASSSGGHWLTGDVGWGKGGMGGFMRGPRRMVDIVNGMIWNLRGSSVAN